MNYAQNLASVTLVTTTGAFPTAISSASITTNGNPVQIIAVGDAENLSSASSASVQLYRNSTAIGGVVVMESLSISENSPWALEFIDAPGAGTYTYAVKVNSITGGNFNFGQTSGATISTVELANVKGPTGPTGSVSLLNSYTVSQLTGVTPSISPSPGGQLVYVSDGASNQYMAISNGTAWYYPSGTLI